MLAEGWSRPQDPHDHAEEAAILALGPHWAAPPGTTLYSSMEPCSTRASRPRSCTQLILAAGISRVVFAWREPTLFVEGRGAELLAAAGVEVVEVPQLAESARRGQPAPVRPVTARARRRNRRDGPGWASLPFSGC